MTPPTREERRANLERMRDEYANPGPEDKAIYVAMGQLDVESALKMLDEEEGR